MQKSGLPGNKNNRCGAQLFPPLYSLIYTLKKVIYLKKRKQFLKLYKAYNHKKSNIETRLRNEFIDHGIATIPCKVNSIEDIISPFSVPGYESLNSSFVEYISGISDAVPDYCPIVLSIVGHKFTEEQQNTIRNTIVDDCAYNLGSVEKENRHHLNVFLWMAAGLVLSCILLAVLKWQESIQLELLFVVFWFCADVFVDYLLIEGWQLKKQRIRAARLACLKVTFSEEYDERDYSEQEAEEIINELYRET